MKKIALTLLSLFLITPCLANIHINPSTVESVVKEFVPADKVVSVISEYNNQLKQSNGTGISAQKLWNICAIASWDIKQPSGKSQCQKFVNALVKKSSIKFYHACAKENKGKAGYICVDDFFTNKVYGGTQVNLTPGQTLAQEYARLKHNDSTVQCRNKFDPGTLDDTLMCTSHNKNTYYEFVFDDLKESKDKAIQDSIQSAICRMYDAKPTTASCISDGSNVNCWSASCAADSAKCAKINQSMAKFGYSAVYKDNKCEINFNSINDKSKLKTAYGIDNFVFCHGIQVANAPNVETYLKQYVAQRAGVSASSVKCDSGFYTYTGTGCTRNGVTDLKDDIKTCRVGDNQIDFVFDDVNEKWKKTVEGGVQGMSCIVTGGTYSGERCIGLGEQQCNILRQSNLKECPECKAAKWDEETQSCVLPSSESAQNLQKGVNISLIVGGAVVGVVITVATAGAATAAAAGTASAAAAATKTAIVLTAIETVGAGIELTSQLKINGIADEFLVESNKCKNATCAEKLVIENLTELARIGDDLTDAEADATDKEMARLIGLIPAYSDWWIDSLKMDDGSSFLEKANDGGWTAAQVWRAIGIGMQFAGVASSITGWIIKKTGYLEKTLDRTSKILLNSAKTAEKNIVKVDKLDDVGKEWYKLWQEYAPKNQTLEQFKAMTNGNLDEMKQMAKDWIPRSKRVTIIKAQIDKQLDDITAEVQRRSTTFENLMDKYNIDSMPADPNELAQLYKQHPDLEQAVKTLEYARAQEIKLQDAKINHVWGTNYSTFDPEFSKTFAVQKKIDNLDKQRAAIWVQRDEHAYKGAELYKEAEKYDWSDPRRHELYTQASKEYEKSSELFDELEQLGKERDVLREQLPTQWDIAEKYQLQNLGNVTSERAKQFEEIIKANPEIQSKLDEKVWARLSDQERSNVAQKILDEYAAKTGTPRAEFGLDYNTKSGGYYMPGTNKIQLNPTAQFQTADGMLETLSHEHGHFIDYIAPNEGALGEQYGYYAEKIYSDVRDDGYRVALTEQSSFKIGPNVSHEATGTTNPYSGKEYDLEAAKRFASGADLDREVVTYGAVVPAVGGVVAGAEIQVIDAIQNKKDKK